MARSVKKMSPLQKKEKTQRLTRRQLDAANLKFYGDEPEVSGQDLDNDALGKTLNWYSNCEDYDRAREYLIEFAANSKPLVRAIKGAAHINPTYGWVARILNRGGKLESDVVGRFKAYCQSLIEQQPAPRPKSVADTPTKDRISEFLPDFEAAIDCWDTEEFSSYNYLVSNNVPLIYAKRIYDYYLPLLQELKDAYAKNDKQLVEAYSYMTRVQLRNKIAFVTTLVEDTEKFLNNQKKTRAPRKKKSPAANQILKHFKYMASHDQLKIASIDPTNILGASTVFTLNTKNNILTVFHAKDLNGLSVSRTSIANYDEEKSACKRIGRKFQEVLDKLNSGNKTTQRKILDFVNTDYAKFTDRLNEHTIILKAIK